MGYEKPLPAPDPETEPFWNGCRDHKLLTQRRGSCRTHRFPPPSLCPSCQSGEVSCVQARRRARVVSWTVVRHPVPNAVYADAAPYFVAVVLA